MRLPILQLTLIGLVSTFAARSFAADDPQASELERARHEREQPAQSATPHIVIEQAPYKLGEAIFKGTYKFGGAKASHVAEKEHRLGILLPGLPAGEQKHFNPGELASHLSDREMNDLE